MFGFGSAKTRIISADEALPGRSDPIPTSARHAVFGRPLKAPVPAGMAQVVLGMGCFWGVERIFWQREGVWLTAAGYAGGYTPNPTYEEVCSGRTGHNEVVRVVYDPSKISFDRVLQLFWEGHDPTQGMRQGNDRGTQYRSGLYLHSADERRAAEASRDLFAARLQEAGYGPITTEILPAPEFYYAEDYHQQYLHKNPQGYCGLGGTGVSCPIGLNA